MTTSEHNPSLLKTWSFIVLLVGWVLFKGLLAYQVIGDLGQPDWDYRPIPDVPGESPYAVSEPYHPLPNAQHVMGKQGTEENPSQLFVVPVQGVK